MTSIVCQAAHQQKRQRQSVSGPCAIAQSNRRRTPLYNTLPLVVPTPESTNSKGNRLLSTRSYWYVNQVVGRPMALIHTWQSSLVVPTPESTNSKGSSGGSLGRGGRTRTKTRMLPLSSITWQGRGTWSAV